MDAEFQLELLLAQYDLRLVCGQCSEKVQEITYRCKSVQHQCTNSLLLCRARDSSLWRPVSKRPTHPIPKNYNVCRFFEEGSGCTAHKKRCYFARSLEEAAVWDFAKELELDHRGLCKIIAQHQGRPRFDHTLDLKDLDLRAVCEKCCVQEKQITYTIKSVWHKCSHDLLLAKSKTSDKWRPVGVCPPKRHCGQFRLQQVCQYFTEGSGCTKFGEDCVYARSDEEATVWNYVKEKQMLVKDLIKQVAVTPGETEKAAQDIAQQFLGQFTEFCSECFYKCPTKLTVIGRNDTCSAKKAHTWRPLLVHHPAGPGKRLCQIRPLPETLPLTFCNHVKSGTPCRRPPGQCVSAQSEIELKVWRAEQRGLMVRPLLLQLQPKKNLKMVVPSPLMSFSEDWASVEHNQRLWRDTSVRTKRPPSPSWDWFSDRPTGEHGACWFDARSDEEPQERTMRPEEVETVRRRPRGYNDRLLQEYRDSSDKEHVMTQQLNDVRVSCDGDFIVNCELVHTKRQWKLQVRTKRSLAHVALLKQEPGAWFSLDDLTLEPCTHLPGHSLLKQGSKYEISVNFTSDVPGVYEQWLTLDFDTRPVLLMKLRVSVGQGPSADDGEDSAANYTAASQEVERWDTGNRRVDCHLRRTEEQGELQRQYKPPEVHFLYKPGLNPQTGLNHNNYKEQMHHFLYSEEHAEEQVVSRLNIRGEMKVIDHCTLRGTEGTQLFGTMTLPFSLTKDSPEGVLVPRSIQSVLIASSSRGPENCVYEAIILLDKTTDRVMFLELSENCCVDLSFKPNVSYEIDVQFQLNRHYFCMWHKAIDLLPDTQRVLPDLKNCIVPVNNIQCDKLNGKQRLAVEYITGKVAHKRHVAPLLICGPSGTGKTFILATAAVEVCQHPLNKVLICTHTDSSADLYLRDHFHTVKGTIRPLQVKANTSHGLSSTDETARRYCILTKDKTRFLPPTKAILDQHNIIIITTTTAWQLHKLKLSEGYFSHILIDEASQMLEWEALSAVGLAGENTRVALAGDHLKMEPKLFSVDDRQCSGRTLFKRLFHYYELHQYDAAQSGRIILSDGDVGEQGRYQSPLYNKTDPNPPEIGPVRGILVKKSRYFGYVIPFKNPYSRINIKGRQNLGKTFTGDEVCVQNEKVTSIIKEDASSRLLLCTLEEEDHSKTQNSKSEYIWRMMIPLSLSAPKISVHINKKFRHELPVWKKDCGEWTQEETVKLNQNYIENHVFLVQVISWNEDCLTPLGYVVKVLPTGNSVSEDLGILNQQYNVAPMAYSEKQKNLTDKNKSSRKDRCNRTTFTVDPPDSHNLDDAISVEENGEDYELGIHIADVASYIPYDDELDEEIKQRSVTYYSKSNMPVHLFPQELSTGLFSLLPGKERSVLSLIIKVDKVTHETIGKPQFELSTITSNHQFSYKEAEEVINGQVDDTISQALKRAYEFSKVQRKKRVRNWPYAQADENRFPGDRKAHLMIEELSVYFNHCVSELLSNERSTEHLTPLRCQRPPSLIYTEKLLEFSHFSTISFNLWHIFDCKEQNGQCESFRVIKCIWEKIREATKANDIDRLVDLIASDDIYPQLSPITNNLKKCMTKAFYTRSRYGQNVGHYSLNLKCYTNASSPIRRYVDIVLQRLMHCYILKTPVPYTTDDIEILCHDFDRKVKCAKEYERKVGHLYHGERLKKQSVCTVVFVVEADENSNSFSVVFPFNKTVFPETTQVMYKDLRLDDQPQNSESHGGVILKWTRRIYKADKDQPDTDLTTTHKGTCLEIPFTEWKSIVEAVKEENWDEAKLLISKTEARDTQQTNVNSSSSEGHNVQIMLRLQPGDMLQVQMTGEKRRAFTQPVIQLMSITPKFELCFEHVHNPIACFSQCAKAAPRCECKSTEDYVNSWGPLCEMESLAAAVNQGDIITIRNLEVNFFRTPGDQDHLQGEFFLHSSWITDWAIYCNLMECLLCIRKPGLPVERDSLEKHDLFIHTESADPSTFTWVAHGLTTDALPSKRDSCHGKLVHFIVNHRPMMGTPDSIFNSQTTFTVELIPKSECSIRTKSAVINVPNACELVQSIACGNGFPKDRTDKESWLTVKQIQTKHNLPLLNQRQHKAVREAINNSFLVIHGPPGTGKTMVGVYIALAFDEMNRKDPRNENLTVKNKKQVILYCGPSNKSVDVVAEVFLKCKDSPKILRVYGEQFETLDYPSPGSVHQFFSKARADRVKKHLWPITLHHRIRQPSNPHSTAIKFYDKCIQKAIDGKEPLTSAVTRRCLDALSKGRAHELEQHDIILCTCTESSSTHLTSRVNARQILIDESAMATEPQTLIPLVHNVPEKVVLIGDHMQLQPFVQSERVRRLGMSRSLFERYQGKLKHGSVTLDTQYRMHKDICEFPSTQFYQGLLKTAIELPDSVLRVGKTVMPVVCGNVRGKTVHQVVSTPQGNERSKANYKEAQKVVKIVLKLTDEAKVNQSDIAVLTPYNMQVFMIKEELRKAHKADVNVRTITKSQGSEWKYVIISTVSALPEGEELRDQDPRWISRHVGLAGNPNHLNVAITRAKEGLCILGDMELLYVSHPWKSLLDHYESRQALTEADKISVCERKQAKHTEASGATVREVNDSHKHR